METEQKKWQETIEQLKKEVSQWKEVAEAFYDELKEDSVSPERLVQIMNEYEQLNSEK